MRRKLLPLVTLLLVAVLGVGCSNGSSTTDTGTGSAGATSSSSSTTGGSATSANRAMGVKFAECMRNNGVPDFPDPDAKGEFTYGASVTPTVFTKAVNACKALQPPGALSSKRTPEQQSASLRFAQCVRDNGVKDFPDPVNGEPLIDTYKIPSSNKPGGMTILNAAVRKCRDLLDKAASGR